MIKVLPIMVVGILVLSGLGAADIHLDREIVTEITTLEFPSPVIVDKNSEYIKVSIEESGLYLTKPGQPMVPKIVKSFELEFGVRNVKVEVIPKETHEVEVSKEIVPAPVYYPSIPIDDFIPKPAKDEEVYGSDEFFPNTWYDYHVGCGLNSECERVTHVAVHLYPVRYNPLQSKLLVSHGAEIILTYEKPDSELSFNDEYDLVIIAPEEFSSILQPLVDFKNEKNMRTFLKTTEEIYREYAERDKPEEIKYFIKDAIENFNIKYVLLFGGLKSLLFAHDRENKNTGTRAWHVPARYSNLVDPGYISDPGYLCDLYYADIYKEGGVFDDWDSNGNGIYAEWKGFPRDRLDLYPDVYVGRMACRNTREAEDMVKKIITYEQNPANPSWFNKFIVISGDGFQDQPDLNIEWDTKDLPDGRYTIYAQSINEDGEEGPVDSVTVTLDKSAESSITFTEDDHLKTDSYPFLPIAEITSPSNGDVLGKTKVNYVPPEAYIGDRWARVEYQDGVMHIRGKSYDPRPYGVVTDLKVWIENSNRETVFSQTIEDIHVYYEGEWETGERLLHERGGALAYMPEKFKKVILWTSNGKFTGQSDVLQELSKGSGFVYFAGHGNPRVWANHYPGIPGGRGASSVLGLATNLFSPPYFPMNTLSNINKPFVLVVGGCHNSQFNVTIIKTMMDRVVRKNRYWTYGVPLSECWSWWLVKLSQTGAIATMGNTGLGYGYLGDGCTLGLGGWISPEFFRQYGEEGHEILGEAYGQAITNYLTVIGGKQQHDAKTVQEWVLLGDPSLKIGGYS
jgi:hypothetical protein